MFSKSYFLIIFIIIFITSQNTLLPEIFKKENSSDKISCCCCTNATCGCSIFEKVEKNCNCSFIPNESKEKETSVFITSPQAQKQIIKVSEYNIFINNNDRKSPVSIINSSHLNLFPIYIFNQILLI